MDSHPNRAVYRQRTRGIGLGSSCYLGSEVRAAPGVEIPASCIVALGSVLTGQFSQAGSLIAGNPAHIVHPLNEQDLSLVTHKTRNDIPCEMLCNETATA